MWCVARELAGALHLDPSPARLARRFDDPEVRTPFGAAVEGRLRPLQPRHLLVECGAWHVLVECGAYHEMELDHRSLQCPHLFFFNTQFSECCGLLWLGRGGLVV